MAVVVVGSIDGPHDTSGWVISQFLVKFIEEGLVNNGPTDRPTD